ncbi:MAG: FtsX-like permease family protein, partial [Deltaproteobacteria bacterium]|nr:FtsX-like permease family protein [Deltaproteobacteria bacterium]
LALLGKVALATSGLLVLNFLTLSLHARLRQLAVLRALGATRAQVFGGVLGECALVGALGSGAGVALGAFVANAMAAWASASFSTQFHEPVTLTRVAPEPLTLAGCFALTFVTALLAGVWPAFRAARVTPVALFRAGAGSGDPIRPPRTGRPLLDYVLQAGFRQPSRSFLGIACMVVSLTAVVTVSLLNSSFKETLRARMEYGFLPDVVLIPKGSSRVDQRQPFHESLVKELERLPGVKGAYGQRIVPWTYRGRKVSIRSFDDPGAEHGYRMLEVIDRPTAEAGRELYTSSDATVVVSQAFTRTFDQRTGDRLELDTPSGHVSARVVGVINDSTSPVGAIYLSHPRYRELWRDPLLSGIGVMVRDAAQGEAVRREIVARLGDSRNLLALSKDEWVSNVFGVIDSAFAYASILELVTLFIAAFGLFNCVFLNVLDRSREFALLRALGGSRVQIFKLVLGETALYCAVATLLSGLLGASLVYACTMGPLQPLIGWMIRFSWSGAALARCLGAMGLATVLASALPGHRAANVEPALAMRCD